MSRLGVLSEGFRLAGESIADAIRRLVDAGMPENTARKIVSGELPMDQASRMARANEQGFDTDTTYYHGTPKGDISAFDLAKANSNTMAEDASSRNAIFATKDPSYADVYNRYREIPDAFDESIGIMPNDVRAATYPIMVKGDYKKVQSPITSDKISQAKAEGYAGLTTDKPDEIAVFDPSNIRSVNAAFDPENAGKPNLLGALSAAAPYAGGAGILAAGMAPEDADAGVISRGGKKLIDDAPISIVERGNADPRLLAAMAGAGSVGAAGYGALSAPYRLEGSEALNDKLAASLYGEMKAPKYPGLLAAGDALQSAHDSIQGPPFGILSPLGDMATWAQKVGYDTQPDWLESLGAALGVAEAFPLLGLPAKALGRLAK